ncbi:protein of unknown function [Vibrio tapetis subsp. tapetis]|uniref:Uncharacterized protein n=1 Tax=Vibrio tapetis subsp. tapetis TaxID=1671868 RepID=A0A2N8ZAY5_9VIBR|nr:protein of unknown function [Vibrio tapetis subsp. tapetis]
MLNYILLLCTERQLLPYILNSFSTLLLLDCYRNYSNRNNHVRSC